VVIKEESSCLGGDGDSRVGAGLNTSTIALRVVGGDEK
jgi:hypothetical protein